MIQKNLTKGCPICESKSPQDTVFCSCGYDFETNKLGDRINISKDLSWDRQIKIKKNVHLFLKKNNSQIKQWGIRDTAKFLNESKSTVSADIQLATAVGGFPDLANCRNKSEARRSFDDICRNIIEPPTNVNNNGEIFDNELELRSYLRKNWPYTTLANEWELRHSEYDTTTDVGRIDLLAYHKTKPIWLVIELKVLKSSDITIAQLLRYMGWIKTEFAQKFERVEGLIIAKSVDENTYYSLQHTKNVTIKIYRIVGNKFYLKDIDQILRQQREVARIRQGVLALLDE